MNSKPDRLSISSNPEKSVNLLAARVDELRRELRQRQAEQLADYTLSIYTQNPDGTGEYRLGFWEQDVVVTHPAFDIVDISSRSPLNPGQQALILYYFYTANGSLPTGEWISFSNLQDGRFYAQAFQGYTGNELSKVFRGEQVQLERAASILLGKPYPLGDAAFEFILLPKIHLLVVFWQGDEDFPPNYQILFDASVNQFLPTDACAIAGSMLTRKLIKAYAP
jgi:hypothetical protein